MTQFRYNRPFPSSSFYRSVYSEIEEVGWENLVMLVEDLSRLTFHVVDKKGQKHFVETLLPLNYPKSAPSISGDVPYACNLKWSRNSKLKDALDQYIEHLDKFQELWSTLAEIDQTLTVVFPKNLSRATLIRPDMPRCRFFGQDSIVDVMMRKWKRNCKNWTNEKSFAENFENILEIILSEPSDVNNEEQVECGICYAHNLPLGDGLETKNGSIPDYNCANENCSRAFHSVCLRDWLHSITTTRQSFNFLFGNCPYCSEPVAVKVHDNG